jgi:formate/nitrite transporter FocA (FNT family)
MMLLASFYKESIMLNKLWLAAIILVAIGVGTFFGILLTSDKPHSEVITISIIGILCFGLGYNICRIKIERKQPKK